uniref:U-box domain-containing protein 12 n=1 Tax=Davidia involucrata TaxID=16924 RepID=A0A5B7AYL7_DAVIN
MPLFEEFMDIKEKLYEDIVKALVLLKQVLESANELLRIGSRGSKILLVLQSEQIKNKFEELTVQFEHALSGISYDKLGIPDELKEQVELVHAQFGRTKERTTAPDLELYEYLFSIYNQSNDVDTDPTILRTLCEKLEVMSVEDLKEESLALHEMVVASGRDEEESTEKMSMLLKKFEDFLQAENPNISISACENCSGSDQACTDLSPNSPKSPVVPDDFRCPISLELMKDPVIICTGQTYERACIKKWLEAGHGTCPKTQQKLYSTTLTPNYVLCSLITNWCEVNGVEPPRRLGNSRLGKISACSVEGVDIDALLSKLTCGNIEDQRATAGELRLLAKNNGDNRIVIAEAGAIPLLAGLLFTPDTPTQEHAVTALLNLSICEDNKRSIISSGAVPGILYVLKSGSMEARENAAATIFSLTTVDEFKVTIGALGAIPVLVTLLREGSHRGKKDAAAALFNLCIYQGNKGRAIRAGMVPPLVILVTERGGDMVDEALAILSMLASHPEGKAAIGALEVLPLLVELIQNGSLKNKENATAVLVHLCAGDHQHLSEARALGVMDPLSDLAENGSDRAKRKAAQLLELMSNSTEQCEQAQLEADAQSEAQTQSLQLPVTAAAVDYS